MVVQHVQVRVFLNSGLRLELRTKRVSEVIELLRVGEVLVPRDGRHLRNREVVQTHVHPILEDCKVLELFHLLGSVLLAAKSLAILIDLHVRDERRSVGLFACERLSKVFGEVLDFHGLTERKLIVIELKRCFSADESLDLHVDRFPVLEGTRGNTGEVESLRHLQDHSHAAKGEKNRVSPSKHRHLYTDEVAGDSDKGR
mmetsp:Transcript_56451/g.115519  ORF Transcript_56451/g.115519 Transcript_56451/m.115519 type:complete len:200 (-) Transcript_56451:3-602(-)